jgi:hypothetical protein
MTGTAMAQPIRQLGGGRGWAILLPKRFTKGIRVTIQQATIAYTEGWSRYSRDYSGIRAHRTDDGVWVVQGMARCNPAAADTFKLDSNQSSIIAYIPDGLTPRPPQGVPVMWTGNGVAFIGGSYYPVLANMDFLGSISAQVIGCPANSAPTWLSVNITFVETTTY